MGNIVSSKYHHSFTKQIEMWIFIQQWMLSKVLYLQQTQARTKYTENVEIIKHSTCVSIGFKYVI